MKSKLLLGILCSFGIISLGLTLFSPKLSSANVLDEKTANNKTMVTVLQGDVFVNDAQIENQKELFIGDTVKTGDESMAEILFSDYSVSRLSSNTEIIIQELPVENKGRVMLKTIKGEVWSKILKIINGQSRFEMETDVTVAAVRGSAFNIRVDACNTEIISGEHTIWFERKDSDHSVAVVEGKKALLDACNEEATDISIQDIDDTDAAKLESHSQKDKQYKQELESKLRLERKTQAGVLPNSPLYALKELQDTLALKAAQSEDERLQVELKIAKRKFVEAQVLLESGEKDLAKKQMDEFSFVSKKVASSSESLREKVESTVAEQKQMLVTTSFHSPLYEARKHLDAVEVDTAENDVVKKEIKKWQLNRRVLDIHDSVKEGRATYKAVEEMQKTLEEMKENNVEEDLKKEAALDNYIQKVEEKAAELPTQVEEAPADVQKEEEVSFLNEKVDFSLTNQLRATASLLNAGVKEPLAIEGFASLEDRKREADRQAKLQKEIERMKLLEAQNTFVAEEEVVTDVPVLNCSRDQHGENGKCIADVRTCSIAHGSGQQSWNGSWGSCIVTSCDSGYTQSGSRCVTENNTEEEQTNNEPQIPSCNNTEHYDSTSQSCEPNVKSCDITNGSGEKTWLDGSWSNTCTLKDCNDGYEPADDDSNICVLIDTTPPTVTGIVNNGVYKEATINFENSDDVASKILKKDNAEIDYISTITEEGSYTLTVADAKGNEDSINFTIDTTVPEINGVEDGGIYQSVTPIFTGTSTTYKSNSTITEEGDHTLTVTDAAGNSSKVTFTIDRTAPSVTVNSVTSSNDNTAYANTNNTITIAFTSSEALKEFPKITIGSIEKNATKVDSEGKSWIAEIKLDTYTTQGIIPYTINFSDAVGNTGTKSDDSSITFDSTVPVANMFVDQFVAPSASITLPTENNDVHSIWFISTNVSGSSRIKEQSLIGETTIIAPSSSGDYKYQVADAAGNISTLSSSIITVNNVPAINNSISDQTARKGKEFVFTIPNDAFTDNDSSDSLSYDVSFDQSPSWIGFNNVNELRGTPTSTSSSTVTIFANDGKQDSESITFTINVSEQCGAGLYLDDHDNDPNTAEQCTPVSENGTYSPADNDSLLECTNTKPTNAYYSSIGGTNGDTNNCEVTCNNPSDILNDATNICEAPTPTNNAPTVNGSITAISGNNIRNGIYFKRTITNIFSDSDGDTLTYHFENLPSGISQLGGTNSLTISGTPSVSGEFTATVTASDGVAETDPVEFTITIAAKCGAGEYYNEDSCVNTGSNHYSTSNDNNRYSCSSGATPVNSSFSSSTKNTQCGYVWYKDTGTWLGGNNAYNWLHCDDGTWFQSVGGAVIPPACYTSDYYRVNDYTTIYCSNNSGSKCQQGTNEISNTSQSKVIRSEAQQ